MVRPTLLTNPGMLELDKLHGDHEQAVAFRQRGHLPSKPKDGSGKLETRVLIMNDLHLGAGSDVETPGCNPSEDFTDVQESQFETYLAREWRAASTGDLPYVNSPEHKRIETLRQLSWEAGEKVLPAQSKSANVGNQHKLHLVLNGDIVDFMQTIVERPGMPYPDGIDPVTKAPLNTPANVMMQLNVIRQGHPGFFRTLATHLKLGHSISMVPGNHDRQLYNSHVWSGEITTADGKRYGGMTKIMEQELRALGASENEVRDCLSRLERRPFAIFGDVWVEHGDMSDQFNRTRRPFKEMLEPSQIHEVMPEAFGDYGVKGGFNQIEPLDPELDNMTSGSLQFFAHALRHPFHAWKLVRSFVDATAAEGYTTSPARELDQRVADMRAMADLFPDLLQTVNQLRPEGEKLDLEQLKDALEAIERVSATPLYSNFAKGSSFITRLLRVIVRPLDKRTGNDVILDQAEQANKKLGINVAVRGHTHAAEDKTFLTDEEKSMRYVNTATWLTQKGFWGRGAYTWGSEGRGVGVIEMGVDAKGQRFVEMALQKVEGKSADLTCGEIMEDAIKDEAEEREKVGKIFENNARLHGANVPRLVMAPQSYSPAQLLLNPKLRIGYNQI